MPKRKINSAGVALKNPLSVKKKVSDPEEPAVLNPLIAPAGPAPGTDAEGLTIDPSVKNNIGPDDGDEPQFNLFVGTELGMLKGISFGGELPMSRNIYKSEEIMKKAPAVVSLTWANDEDGSETEKELLVTFSDHIVKTYNTKLKWFTRLMELEVDNKETKLAGLCSHDSGNYVFGLEDGTLSMWNLRDSKITVKFSTGKTMSKIRQCPAAKHLYATGGNENDLKIWNLSSEKPEVPEFKAKNVPHDELDLRVPVWVQDLTFLPRETEVLAVGTRYGHVRLYDVRTSERPVSNVLCFDHAIMSISPTMNDRQVIVGTAKGEAALYDLRNPKHEKLLMKYEGFSGSIRCVEACSDKPYFVSCGLDRHLYVHKFSQKTAMKKLYMKQQMNCLALSSSFMTAIEKTDAGVKDGATNVEGDWANIPSEVLSINKPSFPVKTSWKSSQKC